MKKIISLAVSILAAIALAVTVSVPASAATSEYPVEYIRGEFTDVTNTFVVHNTTNSETVLTVVSNQNGVVTTFVTEPLAPGASSSIPETRRTTGQTVTVYAGDVKLGVGKPSLYDSFGGRFINIYNGDLVGSGVVKKEVLNF